MDLTSLVGLLGKRSESEEAKSILRGFPYLRASTSGFSSVAGTLTESFLSCEKCGFEARLAPSTGIVMALYLMGEGHEGFSEFPHYLAHGLRFGARREAVQATYGSPHWSWSGVGMPVLRKSAGETLRYDFDSHALYFQFHPSHGHLHLVAADLNMWQSDDMPIHGSIRIR